MRNSNVVVSPRLLVFGPKGNLSLCSGWRARRRTCLWSFLECFALLCTPDVLTQKWAFLGTTNVTDGVYGFGLGWKECVWWCLIPVHVNRQTNQPRVLARRVPYNARLWLFFFPLSLHPRFARWELTLWAAKVRKGSSWPPDKGIGVGATLEGRRCDFEGRRAASSCIRQLLVWRRWATARAPSPAPPPDNVGLPIAKLSKRVTWYAHCFEGARERANRVNFHNQ